jgi:hypothetical protein
MASMGDTIARDEPASFSLVSNHFHRANSFPFKIRQCIRRLPPRVQYPGSMASNNLRCPPFLRTLFGLQSLKQKLRRIGTIAQRSGNEGPVLTLLPERAIDLASYHHRKFKNINNRKRMVAQTDH